MLRLTMEPYRSEEARSSPLRYGPKNTRPTGDFRGAGMKVPEEAIRSVAMERPVVSGICCAILSVWLG